MPKRSNWFQKLVYVIHAQLSESANVKESALLINGRTGEEREIDIVIDSEAAGYPVVVGIECRDWKRPQSVEWVEQMWAKHQDLPTTLFVRISGPR